MSERLLLVGDLAWRSSRTCHVAGFVCTHSGLKQWCEPVRQRLSLGCSSCVPTHAAPKRVFRCLAAAGVIAAGKGVALTVSSSEFSDNFAAAFGGAISLDGASLAVTDSQFVNNTAQLYGGAISQTGGAADKVTIAGSGFSGNEAGCQGGTLFFYDLDSVTVTDTEFDTSATAYDPTTTSGVRLTMSCRRQHDSDAQLDIQRLCGARLEALPDLDSLGQPQDVVGTHAC